MAFFFLLAAAAARPPGFEEEVSEELLFLRSSYQVALDRASDDETADPRRPRYVPDGHWVVALPSPLPAPYVVACSEKVAGLLGLECPVLGVFAGYGSNLSWYATPYALSMYGEAAVPDFAGPRSEGDGRVIFLGEKDGWEVQLKGAGKTAFSRTATDAVLRSSTREFLAAEAMYHLGVATTRALSVVASETEKVKRPWYNANASSSQRHGGDALVVEKCAITTRVARSFVRVGTFELFARRARDLTLSKAKRFEARKQLEKLAKHVSEKLLGDFSLTRLCEEAAKRQARLAADWLRVGYVQSNFNSDNCLVSGARPSTTGLSGSSNASDPTGACGSTPATTSAF